MTRVGAREGASVRRATPGQLLSARAGVRAVRPGDHGPAWLAASAHYTQLAEVLTGRLDVHVVLAPAAAGTTATAAGLRRVPGRFVPALSRVDLDGLILPGPPDALDLTSSATLQALAVLHGVFVHEIGHCEHTRWRPRPTSTAIAETVAVLEEVRMEARVCATRPAAHTWLRAAASHLLLADLTLAPDTVWGAACLATLTLGRVTAGSLLPGDVAPLRPALEEVLGREVLNELSLLWSQLCEVGDEDHDTLVEIAERFRLLTRTRSAAGAGGEWDREGEGEGQREGQRAAGGPGDSQGGGAGADHTPLLAGGTGDAELSADALPSADAGGSADSGGSADDLASDVSGTGGGELLRGAVRDAAGTLAGAVAASAPAALSALAEEVVEAVTARVAAGREEASSGSGPAGAGAGGIPGGTPPPAPGPPRGGALRLARVSTPAEWVLRDALPEERASRRRLAESLRRARWRGRVAVPVASALPPGRLRSRSALTRAAEVAAGRVPTARPWRRSRSEWAESPVLRAAVLVDVSGSMAAHQAALSSAVWVLATAVADASGSCEVVAFGDETVRLTSPGRSPEKVTEILAEGATESISSALALATSDLSLEDELSGPRLVVVVSDGVWVEESEAVAADARLTRLRARGCQVLLVGVGQEPAPHPADLRVVLTSPDDLVALVGEAARRSLLAPG